MTKINVDQALRRAKALERKGAHAEARTVYLSVLEAFPKNARAQTALKRLPASLPPTKRALHPEKTQLDAVAADIQAGAFSAAIHKGEVLLKAHPDSFVLWNLQGAAYKKLGDLDKAEAAFRTAGTLKEDFAEAHHNLGIVLSEHGKYDAAVLSFEKAVALRPNAHDAHMRMGVALQNQGRFDAAIDAFERALALTTDDADIYCHMAVALKARGRFADSAAAYRRALALKPNDARISNNLGFALNDCGQLKEAIAAYQQAITLKPDYALAHHNLGDAYYAIGKLDDSIAAYKRVLELQPDATSTKAYMWYAMMQCCDWRVHDQMASEIAQLGITTEPIAPFPLLAMDDDAERQMQRSQAWVLEQYTGIVRRHVERPKRNPERLHIGYFGADFHTHPCLFLMMGVLTNHNPETVKVSVYSYGKDKTGDLRERAIQAVDQFHDVSDMADEAIVDLAHAHKVDVAIDLMGHTRNARLGLFQRGLAPIQVTYLGFPGTTGTTFTDYLVGDPTVIPVNRRNCFTEHVITLPYSYLANDNTLPIDDSPTTRADFGLPDDALVFCSFNNNYKIGPREFDIWMRLLSQIDGSVLWLLKSNPWSEANLRNEAAARGIDPNRLIFADKVAHSVHLARQRHADLFLDTFNYNAHTTASEALWAGLPLVTKIGDQFAARVAASLLKSIGLPELITTTEAEYEALILELAKDGNRRQAIREKLSANRGTQPLFHSEQNTRAFEDGLRQAYDLWFAGKAPQDIQVAAQKR